VITLLNTTLEKHFWIDGQEFTLNIEGFVDGGKTVQTVYTGEGATSSFNLVASISEATAPVLEGKVTPDYGLMVRVRSYGTEPSMIIRRILYIIKNEYGTFVGRSDGSYNLCKALSMSMMP
jgi:bacillopeptidase F (M6 metalloprotease family)